MPDTILLMDYFNIETADSGGLPGGVDGPGLRRSNFGSCFPSGLPRGTRG
jgi:hypothetical protein